MGLSCSLSVALVLMTQTNHTWLDTRIYSRLHLLVALSPPWSSLPFQGGAGSYQLVDTHFELYTFFQKLHPFFSVAACCGEPVTACFLISCGPLTRTLSTAFLAVSSADTGLVQVLLPALPVTFAGRSVPLNVRC